MKTTLKKLKWKMSMALIVAFIGAATLLTNVSVSPVYANEQEEIQYKKVIETDHTKWQYLDDNKDPAQGLESLQAWTNPDYDDTNWQTAFGAFGAKKGRLESFNGFTPTVLLKQYYEANINTPTFFFRTKINIENLDSVTSIKGSFFHDDAASMYVNGQLLKAIDMPTTPQASNMYYAGVAAGAPKEAMIDIRGDKIQQFFVEGENTIAIEIHNDRNTSSDLYFEFREFGLYFNEDKLPITQKAVMLSMGADETSKNISWYANTNDKGTIQYATKESMQNEVFPANCQNVDAISMEANDAGFYAFQATMANLEANTQYVYRLVNGDTVSDNYYFSTKSTDEFNFVLVGDPQIGSSGADQDALAWKDTLDKATSQFDPDFIVSAGDQVNNAANEKEYTGYIQKGFQSYANAPSIGNHDSGSTAYNEHFHLPNESDMGMTTAGSDYWYVYNDTLFMTLNSNNRSSAEHKAFMEDAIAKNPGVRWKTVVFHHSIYSTASHYDDSDIINRRNELPAIFEDLNIDVVLMGHDHVYTRTYMMDDNKPDTAQGNKDSVLDPAGILYLTANSASGSKYYDIKVPDAEFAAKQDQSYRKTLTNVEVSHTAYTLTTYYADDMSVLDSFTIHKTADVDVSHLQTLLQTTLNKVDILNKEEYTKTSWTTLIEAIDQAQIIIDSIEGETNMVKAYTQADVDSAYSDLERAYAGLIKKVINDITNDKHPSSTAPSTGDTSNVAGWLVIILIAGSGILILYRKKA